MATCIPRRSPPRQPTLLDAPRPIVPSVDQFSVIASCSGVIATEFSYRKDEEIYGEGEPSEYVYQVIRGAVRTYKLSQRRTAPDRRFPSAPATCSGSIPARPIA